MAEAADTAPAQRRPAGGTVATATAGDASAMMQQALALLFPSNLAAKAALFALVVALLPLLPSGQEAPARIWELPYLLLLGIVISYGVFGQKNADAAEAAAAVDDAKPVVDGEAAVEAYVSQMMQGSLPLVFEGDGDRDGGASKGGVQTWSSRYLPDDPLVVVADTAGTDGDTGEKPLLLPVRKLKPTAKESATATLTVTGEGDVHMTNIIDEEEEEEELLLAPSKAGTGYDAVREHAAVPSPPSVLDADLTLSPPSPPLLAPPPPPPPPPFLGRGRVLGKAKARSFNEFGALGSRSTNGARFGLHGAGDNWFRSKSAVQATRRRAFAGYEPVVPIDDDGDDEKLEEMVAASDGSSFSSDAVATADVDDDDDDAIMEEINSCEEGERGEDDGNSCDEELFELAARPGALAETEEEEVEEEVEDEVDRKADEFIAKFREQIRMQRGEPATRR